MKIRSIALLTLLCFAPAVSAATGEVDGWLTSVDAAVDAAADGDRKILVDLYADWCGWCKVLEEKVFTTPEFRTFTQDMVLLRVDVEDGGEGSELQARFGANSLPTTLILDSQLAKIGEVSGYAPTPRFLAAVRGQLQEYEAMLEFYERVRRGDDLALMRRLGEDLHARGDTRRAATLYEAALDKAATGSTTAAWLHYLAADAHRLNSDLGRAESRYRTSRQLAKSRADEALNERLDMLRFHLAHDTGDCPEAVASLEKFLESHPRSSLRSQARYTLAALRRGEG
ncbi:MAG: thioredoxin family protein, partial [Acidobacteriota bacterium]